ncbi:MAG: hypothetical protein ABI645_04445 [Pseudomonadota bacterium]
MSRSTGSAAVLAVLMTLGLTTGAQSQETPAKLVGLASCLNAQGSYVITWTLTLTLRAGETASAETPAADFEGLDLVGQPQGPNYPFSGETGNLFTSAWGRLVNGPNVERTRVDTKVDNPESVQAAGNIKTPGASTPVDVTVTRPAACPA